MGPRDSSGGGSIDKGAMTNIYWVSGVRAYEDAHSQQFFNKKIEITNEEIRKYGSGEIVRALEKKLDKWFQQKDGRECQTTILYYRQLQNQM